VVVANPPAKQLVARGSESSTRQVDSGESEDVGAAAICKTCRAQRKAGVERWQPPLAIRPVALGGEPSARQAERNRKRDSGGGNTHLQSVFLPSVASHLQERPSAAQSGSLGAAAPTCQVPRCPQKRAVCKTCRAQRKAGVGRRQSPPAIRFVAHCSEPSARQAERSTSSGGVGASAPTCQAARCLG
jgi:hypothetical protein